MTTMYKVLPLEPTEEMCRAGEAGPGGSSSKPWIGGEYTPENVEQLYKDMVDEFPPLINREQLSSLSVKVNALAQEGRLTGEEAQLLTRLLLAAAT